MQGLRLLPNQPKADDMSELALSFCGADLRACDSGALWWPEHKLLVVSDLHLGKSERIARLGGALLPPYETRETLKKLAREIERHEPAEVICLGDSFDDLMAQNALDTEENLDLVTMMAGRRWIWIEGNHDPGPIALGGAHVAEVRRGPLVFRHIAMAGANGEISGHYHPKARLAGTSRPAFLFDNARLILPAFGAYTGGLKSTSRVLSDLMDADAQAILTGPRQHRIPMPRLEARIRQ